MDPDLALRSRMYSSTGSGASRTHLPNPSTPAHRSRPSAQKTSREVGGQRGEESYKVSRQSPPFLFFTSTFPSSPFPLLPSLPSSPRNRLHRLLVLHWALTRTRIQRLGFGLACGALLVLDWRILGIVCVLLSLCFRPGPNSHSHSTSGV